MTKLVEAIAKSLVDNPNGVEVSGDRKPAGNDYSP